MAISMFSYEKMVEDALRGVLRQALVITAQQGLPGSHHFYITFDTTHPQVRIPEALRQLHPNEMTIVLQHQFWDLKVNDDGFEITLSFSGVSHRLKIPFAAVTAFADPHAKFGLQFHVEVVEKSGADEDREAAAREDAKAGTGGSAGASDKPAAAKSKDPARPAVVAASPANPEGDAKVITLDKFRKK
jgi:hypothetical protein